MNKNKMKKQIITREPEEVTKHVSELERKLRYAQEAKSNIVQNVKLINEEKMQLQKEICKLQYILTATLGVVFVGLVALALSGSQVG